jgi:glutamate-1-semialdehyde aminotransferase
MPRGATAKCAIAPCLVVAAGLVLAACEQPRPISFSEFMEDDLARDGTLARCNQDRTASANDLECANARRAAMAIALSEERARREALEAESERLREELRARIAERHEAERRALEVAEAAERLAYEAQWVDIEALDLPPEVRSMFEQVERREQPAAPVAMEEDAPMPAEEYAPAGVEE